MYTIYADDVCIHSDVTPLGVCKVISPKLTLADSAAGSLEMTLPPGNAGYNLVKRLTTNIIVYENDEEIWSGRILEENIDFWKRKFLYCEGELAFLNDTIQPPHQYSVSDTTITTFLTDLLNIHNSKVAADRQFTLGMVTVTDGDQLDDDDAINRFTNYETTLDCINSKLVERLGGHLRVRHQNGVRYLDYLKDYPGTTNQEIQFGSNLLDFSTNFTAENIATVIIPRGTRLDESPIEGLEAYLTVESVNDGSIYVASEAAVGQYGRIENVVDWPNVTSASTLLSKAQQYLTNEQFNEMELSISAFDLHYLNPSINSIRLLDQVHCVSYAHEMPAEMYTDWDTLATGDQLKVNDRVLYQGNLYKVIQEHEKSSSIVPSSAYEYFDMVFAGKILDKMFPVTQIEMYLDDPSQTIYTMGTKTSLSLTQSSSKTDNDLLNQINSIPSKSSILDAARKNAFNILTGTEGGYVSFDKNENDQIIDIKITNQLEEENSTKKWLWNQGGLGYMERQSPSDEWSTVQVAMTMDGGIVAERVTAGTLTGQTIQGAKIETLQNGYFLSTMADGSYVRISGGMLHVENTDNSYLELQHHTRPDLATLGGRTWGAYNGIGWRWAYVFDIIDAYAYNSDLRIKKDIEDVDMELSKDLVLNSKVHSFRLKDSDEHLRYGVIAQEILPILEKHGIKAGEAFILREVEDYYRVEYEQYIPHLIAVIQDLQNQINELKRKELNNG